MQQVKGTELAGKATTFPFTTADIAYWVVRRKNGECIRWRLDTKGAETRSIRAITETGGKVTTLTPVRTTATASDNYFTSLGRYCNHIPSIPAVFEAGGIELRIADGKGCRDNWDEHDLVIDAGSILSEYDLKKDTPLSGDVKLVQALSKWDPAQPDARVLKIKWADRAAPPLPPEFWPALLKLIKKEGFKRVLTACQGGHGRSGTALVALMMLLSDYTPFQAIVHLRAMHCPRAIESNQQHDYIDEIAKMLGREADSNLLTGVKDYQVQMLALTSEFAIPAQERLKGMTT